MSLLDTASLIVTPNGYKEGKLYSVIPSDGSGDMSVVRATTATRVNSAGLVELVPYNLAQYSQDFTNAVWGQATANGGTISVTANYATAPDGTQTAERIQLSYGSGYAEATQNVSVSSSSTYTYSVYLKSLSGTPTICFLNDGVTGNKVVTLTSNWERYTFAISSAGTFIFPRFLVEVGLTSASADFLAWGAQLVEGLVALPYQKTETRLNIPRLDYSNGTCPSLLVEPQRTNTILNSVLSGTTSLPTSWNVSISTGTSAPTPSIYSQIGQAYSFTTAATRQAIFQNQSYTSGSTYSFSVFVESVTGSIRVDNVIFQNVAGTQTFYKDGVLINASDFIESGHRYTTLMVASSTTTAQVRIGNGTGGATTGTVVLSMPQLELGSYPTSYIPTTSASVTRNADGNLTLITPQTLNDFVLFYDGLFFNDDVLFFGSGGNNAWYAAISPSINRIVIDLASGRKYQAFNGNLGLNQRVKIAIKRASGVFDIFVNGVKLTAGIQVTDTTALSLVSVGWSFSSTYYTQGRINSAAAWQTSLTDAQCQTLTTI